MSELEREKVEGEVKTGKLMKSAHAHKLEYERKGNWAIESPSRMGKGLKNFVCVRVQGGRKRD